jgi:hypothetical protein
MNLHKYPHRAWKGHIRPFATREELAWAGGLFEGEGSFTVSARNRGEVRVLHPVAQLSMVDQSPLLRFAAAVGMGAVYGPYAHKGHIHNRPLYAWSVFGFERTQALIAYLWPFLSERRRLRAAEVLSLYGTERKAA